MTRAFPPWLRCGCALVLSAVGPATLATGPELTRGEPAAAGFSPVRLERLHGFMQQVTESGKYLGAVTLVARHGQVIDWRAYGYRDLAKTSPMQPDSIFRLYSMTKTITSVAVLLLMEEGRFSLEESIAKFLPEFATMQVFAGGTAEAPVLRPADRPITIHQLLTHTAGFACDGPAGSEVVKLYKRAELHEARDLAEFCATLSRLPLATEPGEAYAYGVSLDVLGRLVEVVSGLAFETFLQQRIFAPLGMTDTGFAVPAAKRGRIADLCTTGPDGALVRARGRTANQPGERMNNYCSGAGGLYSTAVDYFRFAQMLLDGGQSGDTTLLSRKTVELMMVNHLAYLGPRISGLSKGDGFGLGGRVLVDVAGRGLLGSPGQFGWSGAGSTYYTVDPRENLVALLLMQHVPQDPHKVSGKFYNLVYQSLAR